MNDRLMVARDGAWRKPTDRRPRPPTLGWRLVERTAMVMASVSTVKTGASDPTMNIMREIVSGVETVADRPAPGMAVEPGARAWCRPTRWVGRDANSRVEKRVYDLATVRPKAQPPADASETATPPEDLFR
jgi:hypothetical protein